MSCPEKQNPDDWWHRDSDGKMHVVKDPPPGEPVDIDRLITLLDRVGAHEGWWTVRRFPRGRSMKENTTLLALAHHARYHSETPACEELGCVEQKP